MNVLDGLLRILGLDTRSSAGARATGDPERIAAIERALADLRPMLALDGGDVTLVDVSHDGQVSVRFSGACRSCLARSTTLHRALEPALRERFEWVSAVQAL